MADAINNTTPVTDTNPWTLLDINSTPPYRRYPDFKDDNYIVIGSNKAIGSSESNQNYTDETYSQFVPFEMPRYYDHIDLAKMNIKIHYIAPTGTNAIIPAINVEYNKDKIHFGWLLDQNVTNKKGNVRFEIQAIGQVSDTQGNVVDYIWKSMPNGVLAITDSLDDETTTVALPSRTEWQTSVVIMLDQYVNQAKEYANSAEESSKAAITTLSNVPNDIRNAMQPYGDKEWVVEQINKLAGIKNLAVKSNPSNGLIEFYDLDGASEITDEMKPFTTCSVDTVNNLKVSYKKVGNTVILTFYDSVIDEDHLITTVDIDVTPSDEWRKTLIDEANESSTKALTDYDTNTVQPLAQQIQQAQQHFEEVAFHKVVLPDQTLPIDDDADTRTLYFMPVAEDQATDTHKYDVYMCVKKNVDGNIVTIWNLIGSSIDTNKYYTKSEIDTMVSNINSLIASSVNEKKVNELINSNDTVKSNSEAIKQNQSNISANTKGIESLSQQVTTIQNALGGVDTNPKYRYELTYGNTNDDLTQPTIDEMFSTDDEDTRKYRIILWEIQKKGEGTESGEKWSAINSFIIQGGSGGGGQSAGSTIVIKRADDSPSPLTERLGDNIVINFTYSSIDSSGDITTESNGVWLLNNEIIASQSLNNAVDGAANSFDVTQYLKNKSAGTYTLTLRATDSAGTMSTKSWILKLIEIKVETTFDDTIRRAPNTAIPFTFTPYGSISKTIHFIYDDEELDSVTTSNSGTPMTYNLPAKDYGSHILKVYIEGTINNNTVGTKDTPIVKSIIVYDENATAPVIGCHTVDFTASQYATTNIVYTVYDPEHENPTVTLSVNGEIVSTLTLTKPTNIWQYRSDTATAEGTPNILTITCGTTAYTINATITDAGYTIAPVTHNLVYDFNPQGKSNSSEEDKNWKYDLGTVNYDGTEQYVNMIVSDNFDWANGGFQVDSTTGESYFLIKTGTRATFDYKMFTEDPKTSGQHFKIIFKTTQVQKADATWLECQSGTPKNIGIQMDVHNGWIRTSTQDLFDPYSENDIIEFDYNISQSSADIPLVMTYEDGVASRPLVYTSSDSFIQPASDLKNLVIGSDYCDVYVYRMKLYNASLSDDETIQNFIADARSSEEMINRYTRNQIADENGNITPESVAKACPDLRVIKLDAPYFTKSKKDYVKDTTVQCIYKNGDPVLDNWLWENCYHAGQGTTSDKYGAAGRNIDIICNADGKNQIIKKIPLAEGYCSTLTLGYNVSGINDGAKETKISDGTGKVSLTRQSVPNNWFNIKVKYLPLYMVTYIESHSRNLEC